jgi:hypothetical protein
MATWSVHAPKGSIDHHSPTTPCGAVAHTRQTCPAVQLPGS